MSSGKTKLGEESKEIAMTMPSLSRRRFNRLSLVALLGAGGGASLGQAASAFQGPAASSSSRRDVITQELPGEPPRKLILVEVTYPPGAASPAHLHANGVMAFVVSGAIVSKVGDGPEQTFKTGDAWWEPPGALHRESRNATSTEPAVLLAIYIAPRGVEEASLMKPI